MCVHPCMHVCVCVDEIPDIILYKILPQSIGFPYNIGILFIFYYYNFLVFNRVFFTVFIFYFVISVCNSLGSKLLLILKLIIKLLNKDTVARECDPSPTAGTCTKIIELKIIHL